MKRLALIIAIAFAAGISAQAQSLKDILSGAAGSAINSVVGQVATVNLTGSWKYSESSIQLKSDNVLSDVAGNALVSGAESKVNSYLQKIGITSGCMTFEFKEDNTFSCTIKGIPMNGTWSTANEGKRVTLKFGKVMSYLSMSGDLSATTSGCKIMFDASSFLNFMKTAMSYVNKKSGKTSKVSSLAGDYKNLLFGWELKRN